MRNTISLIDGESFTAYNVPSYPKCKDPDTYTKGPDARDERRSNSEDVAKTIGSTNHKPSCKTRPTRATFGSTLPALRGKR